MIDCHTTSISIISAVLCTAISIQSKKTEINPSIIEWLYEHSSGVISTVISLIHDAQEIAILNGTEELNITMLNEAYENRLTVLYGYIEPAIAQTPMRYA